MININAPQGTAPTTAVSHPAPTSGVALKQGPAAPVELPSQAATPPQAGAESQPAAAQAVAEQLNRALETTRTPVTTHVHFSVDDETQELVVRIIDGDTDEVVRQIPQEDALKRLSMRQELKGLLFNREG